MIIGDTANHLRHYTAILPPLAVDAGLGEVGRLGYLMTKEFGPRIRLSAVTTNLTLVPDKPVDNGDKWSVVHEGELPAPMKINMECVLPSHDHASASVGINATLQMTGMPGDSSVTSANVTGTMGGTAIVDLRSGFTTHLDLKMKLKGTMTVRRQVVTLEADAEMNFAPIP